MRSRSLIEIYLEFQRSQPSQHPDTHTIESERDEATLTFPYDGSWPGLVGARPIVRTVPGCVPHFLDPCVTDDTLLLARPQPQDTDPNIFRSDTAQETARGGANQGCGAQLTTNRHDSASSQFFTPAPTFFLHPAAPPVSANCFLPSGHEEEETAGQRSHDGTLSGKAIDPCGITFGDERAPRPAERENSSETREAPRELTRMSIQSPHLEQVPSRETTGENPSSGSSRPSHLRALLPMPMTEGMVRSPAPEKELISAPQVAPKIYYGSNDSEDPSDGPARCYFDRDNGRLLWEDTTDRKITKMFCSQKWEHGPIEVKALHDYQKQKVTRFLCDRGCDTQGLFNGKGPNALAELGLSRNGVFTICRQEVHQPVPKAPNRRPPIMSAERSNWSEKCYQCKTRLRSEVRGRA